MNKRIADKQIIFFISYGIFLAISLLRTTLFYKYMDGMKFKLAFALCIVLLAVGEFFLGRNTRRMMAGLIVIAGYMGLTLLTNEGDALYFFISAALFVYCARSIPFRKIALFSVVVLAALLLFVVASSQLGIVTDYISDDGRNRHYLGFRYALYPSTVLMNIVMLYIYIRKQRIRWLELIALCAFNVLMYMATGSRLAFIIMFMCCLISAFLKIWPDFLLKKKKIKYVISMAFIIFAAGSLIASVKYNENSSLQASVNKALSGRLEYQKQAMEMYGFSILGSDVEQRGGGLTAEGKLGYDEEKEEYFYIDNNYVSWYVINGFLFFAAMLLFCTAMSVRSVKYEKRGYLLMMLAMLALFCVIQDTFIYLHFNTFLLAAGNLLLDGRDEEEVEAADPGNRIDWKRRRIRIRERAHLRKRRYLTTEAK